MADQKRREALGDDTDPVIVIQDEETYNIEGTAGVDQTNATTNYGFDPTAPPSYADLTAGYPPQPLSVGSALQPPSPNSSLSSNSINISELCKSPEPPQASSSQAAPPTTFSPQSATCDTSQLLAYTKAKTNELMAWLSCLFCCWPIGLFAVVHANLSDKANCKRDTDKAEYHGLAAKHFAVGAIFAGTLVYLMVAGYVAYLYLVT